jgi:protein involved in polysaccharide export with SLBB domain
VRGRALPALALLAFLGACASTAPDKRVLQYLNDDGFGNRYTGNAEEQNYVTIGDTVSLVDAYHPDLATSQTVDVDGTIVLPEIGAVHVAGQTRSELEAFLVQKYSPYYEQLDIDVRLGTAGKFYFIFGEVGAEGKQQFPGDLTVFEAVMAASPDDRTANLGRVRVIRADPRDPLILYVNLAELLNSGDSTFNVHVHERDIIVVPIAGFVVIAPAAAQGQDVREFFVLRKFRRRGVGRRMAGLVWNEHPGEWLVRVLEANAPAVLFWRAAVAGYSGGGFAEQARSVDGQAWRFFRFLSNGGKSE